MGVEAHITNYSGLYKMFMLPFVFCGCEIWFLNLRKNLDLLENGMHENLYGSQSHDL